MDLPPFSAFNEQEPQAFYLGSPGSEFAGLADATLVAGGFKLPIHSHIVSQHSRLLRSLFSSKSEEGDDGHICLREPFEGFSTRIVATFLRFVYSPGDAAPDSLTQVDVSSILVGVVRLADLLDAPSLLCKLDCFLADHYFAGGSASLSVLVGWAVLAEQCSLGSLRLKCIHLMAHKLASMREAVPYGYVRCWGCRTTFPTFHPYRCEGSCPRCGAMCDASENSKQAAAEAVEDIAPLQKLSHASLMAVLAACTAAARGCADFVPSAADLEAAGAVEFQDSSSQPAGTKKKQRREG